MSDDELGAVDGVPDEARIDEVADSLTADRAVFKRLRTLLAEHFGSHAAARLWLSSPGMGFEPTPLEAVRRGEVRQVLEVLESQWGPNPTYA